MSDAEVVYQLTNNKETSNQVNAMLANGSNVSIEDICNLLTPARREMALAVIELYKRIKERKNNYKRITSSADVYEVMLPYMADLKVEECWVIFLNQACAFWGAAGRWAGAFWRGACWLCGWAGLLCPRRGWLPLARGAFSLRGALGAAGAAACGAGLRGCAGAFPSRAGCCACGALPLPAGRRRRRRCGAPFGVCAAFSIIHLNPVIRR